MNSETNCKKTVPQTWAYVGLNNYPIYSVLFNPISQLFHNLQRDSYICDPLFDQQTLTLFGRELVIELEICTQDWKQTLLGCGLNITISY